MASSSRGVDAYIDEEEEDTCPLCVEEFDITDKNFKPCPCGYQVCQFCYHNIKNNMNGLCPACRRPYHEDTIEYKIVTPEEVAQFKANAQRNAKRKAVERQKEALKREVEHLNRKHLAGLRVIQRNLVYVMGLSPGAQGQDMLDMLKGDKYFGQYGKIIKMAVGKAKNGETSTNIASQGVYVTFARKEDAARCIAAVNGSQNGDRVLRAQLGTTKYCSAYLRNETCTNKACMFLHEPGDNDDSYSRQDLSTINSAGTQRPLPITTPSMTAVTRQITAAQAPMQQPMAMAAPPMAREASKEGSDGDASALPSSASWANRGLQPTSRRGSVTNSGATSSPVVVNAEPVSAPTQETPSQHIQPEVVVESQHTEEPPAPRPSEPVKRQDDNEITKLFNDINSFVSLIDDWPTDDEVSDYPALIDPYGGLRNRLARELQEARALEDEAQLLDQEAASEIQTVSDPHDEELPESGSLQLGGEPDDRDVSHVPQMLQGLRDQRQSNAQLPISRTSNDNGSINNSTSFQNPVSRTMTPQQQQQHMLGLFKTAQASNNVGDQYSAATTSQQSPLFQQQAHTRQSSRYTFTSANENASVKSSSSTQQAVMLPPQSNTFYGSSVQGPPPGLKSTGTPPINGMFGQSAGFGNGIGAPGFSVGRDSNDIYRDMMRGRGEMTGDANKHEQDLLDQDEAGIDIATAIDNLVADDTSETVSSQPVSASNQPSRSGTPSIPPGFEGHGQSSPTVSTTKTVTSSTPFTPSRAASFAHVPHVSTSLAYVSTPPVSPTRTAATTNVSKASVSTKSSNLPKPSTDVQNVKDDDRKPPPSQLDGEGSVAAQSEDFPALSAGKGQAKEPSIIRPTKVPMINKRTTSKATVSPPEIERSGQLSAAFLQTSDATKADTTPPASSVSSRKESSSKAVEKDIILPDATESVSFPPLPPSTAPTSSASTAVRTGPKSLRLLAKTPIPPATNPVSSEVSPSPVLETVSASVSTPVTLPAVPQRQMSLASVLKLDRLDRAGTPTSDLMSDAMSLPSTMSRPNSPPPTRVGAAPVREKTKSQQKKQRKEAMKEKEKVAELESIVDEPEPEIAPIMGRMKKQKKEKPTQASDVQSVSALSRPASPAREVSQEQVEAPAKSESSPSPRVKAVQVGKAKANETKGKPKPKSTSPPSPPPSVSTPPAPTVEVEKEPEKLYSPTAILRNLAEEGEVDVGSLAFLKPMSFNNTSRTDIGDIADFEPRLIITDEDKANLTAGRYVRKVGPPRIMLTPNGESVRNLTPEEEDRYLKLQEEIARSDPQSMFTTTRHNQQPGFTIMQGRALANGPPPYFPLGDNPGGGPGSLDAVSKIQRDEALAYINQYVLPSLSTNSQLERALNANAQESGMTPSNAQSWPLFPNDPASMHSYGLSNNSDQGILATGLESMTAHFGNMSARSDSRGQPLGNVTLLTLADAETHFHAARKEYEKLEKQFYQKLKQNRKILLGAAH